MTANQTVRPKKPPKERHAGDSLMRIRAWIWGACMGPLIGLVGAAGAYLKGASLETTLFVGAASTVLGAMAFTWYIRMMTEGSGATFGSFTMPSGNSTPYEGEDSVTQAQVMRGDIAGALDSLEAQMARAPDDLKVMIRAADLYAGKGGNPARAAEILKAIQRFPEVRAADDVYASNRLIDLYRGPLGESRKALSELRRLADRYPGTDVATRALEALASLKRDMQFE